MLELFILETCPYCHRVMDFLNEKEIEYKKIDISFPPNEQLLINLGGKRQVPFLVDKDNNTMMYESSDIIDYLAKNKI